MGFTGGDLDTPPVLSGARGRRLAGWGFWVGVAHPALPPQLRVAAGAAGACVRAQVPQRLGAAPGRAAGSALGSGGAGGRPR